MKFYIEIHRYAPELNTLHFVKGGSIRAAGVTTIAQARKELFAPVKKGLIVSLSKVYPVDSLAASCNRTACARFDNLRPAIKQIALVRKGWRLQSGVGSVLVDGSVMPSPVISATIKLVG
jgi:hypothetical protein